jgi:transcriptional pleiotropic repressor
MALLQKVRQINKLLQKAAGHDVNFNDMSSELADILHANIFVLSRKGKVLGVSAHRMMDNERMQGYISQHQFPNEYFTKAFSLSETTENIDIKSALSAFPVESQEFIKSGWTTIIPVMGEGKKIALLILSRLHDQFNEEDVALSEYAATVVSMEIMRSKEGEIVAEVRKKAIVSLAVSSLSYSELEAIKHILGSLDSSEGLLVTSTIADRVGITRSTIVSALRKLGSAGVIDSRSLGMKGTHIKLLNSFLRAEVQKVTA